MTDLSPLFENGTERERALGYIDDLIERFPGLVDRAQRAGMNPSDVRFLTETLGFLHELRALVRAPRVTESEAEEARSLIDRIFESAARGIRALLVVTAIGAGGTEAAVNLHQLMEDEVIPVWEAQDGLEETLAIVVRPLDRPDIYIDGSGYLRTVGGTVLEGLTPRQLEIMALLVSSYPGSVTREELATISPGSPIPRSAFYNQIHQIRERLNDAEPGAAQYLVSQRGKGYGLTPRPPDRER